MPAALSIQVLSTRSQQVEEINFFSAELWTKESENQVVQKLYQLLCLIRPLGKGFKIQIDMHVDDVSEAVFLIKKNISIPVSINTQKLSVREIEIIGLIMQGYTNHEIADKLFISYETVKSHRKHILLKTGAKNTAALISYYHQTFFDK